MLAPGAGRRRRALPDRGKDLRALETERCLVELAVLDDAPLRDVRLEEHRLKQPAQCRRHNAAALEHPWLTTDDSRRLAALFGQVKEYA